MSDNPIFVANLDNRQRVLAGFMEVSFQDFINRGNVIDLVGPPGSMIVGGSATVVTASDAATSSALAIGDAGSASRYLAAKDLKAAANTRTALTLTDFKYVDVSGPFLRLTRTVVGAETAGVVRIFYQYVTLGKYDTSEG